MFGALSACYCCIIKQRHRCHLSSNLDVDAFVERSGLDAVIQPPHPSLYTSPKRPLVVCGQEWLTCSFFTIALYRQFLYKSSPLTVSSQ